MLKPRRIAVIVSSALLALAVSASVVPATALQAGDNVIFGLFRDLREGNEDTCTADLTIQGVSIVY
jgi:hypothetical protein